MTKPSHPFTDQDLHALYRHGLRRHQNRVRLQRTLRIWRYNLLGVLAIAPGVFAIAILPHPLAWALLALSAALALTWLLHGALIALDYLHDRTLPRL